ncbi:MAG: hypothetical protein ACPG19_11465 [Saprospiraceae bacterium]
MANKNKYISIEASLYEITFLNITKHSLQVFVKDRKADKVESFTLEPSQKKEFRGNYNRDKLQNLEVYCTYDFETFRSDLIRFQKKVLTKNPKKIRELRNSDWFLFVDRFSRARPTLDYTKDFDFSQITINNRTAKELASDINNKIQKDRTLFASLREGHFASSSPKTARKAVAAILELAHHASDYKYIEQVKYLKEMMVMLSDPRFVQNNRDLIYNIADLLDMRTTATDYLISFTPIIFTQTMNDYWHAPDEVGLDTEKILGVGWLNNTLSLQFGRAVSREARLKKGLYGRFYATAFYEKISYELNPFGIYYLGADDVSVQPTVFEDYYDITNNEDIHLEMTHFGLSGITRLMFGKWVFLDAEGGIITGQGKLRFNLKKEHFDKNINVNSITFDEGTPVLERSYSPFVRIKSGFGYSPSKGQGIYFSLSYLAFQNIQASNDDYGIYTKVNKNIVKVPVTSSSWLNSLTLGIDVFF